MSQENQNLLNKFNKKFSKMLQEFQLDEQQKGYIMYQWKTIYQTLQNYINTKKDLEVSELYGSKLFEDALNKNKLNLSQEEDLIYESLQINDKIYGPDLCFDFVKQNKPSKSFIKKQKKRYKFELMQQFENFINQATTLYTNQQNKDNVVKNHELYSQNLKILKTNSIKQQKILKQLQKNQNTLEEQEMKLLLVKEVTEEAKNALDKIIGRQDNNSFINYPSESQIIDEDSQSQIQNKENYFFVQLQNTLKQEIETFDVCLNQMNKKVRNEMQVILFKSLLCKLFFKAFVNLEELLIFKRRHLETASTDFMSKEIKFMTIFMECVWYYLEGTEEDYQIQLENDIFDCTDIEKLILQNEDRSSFVSGEDRGTFIIFNLFENMTKCGVRCAYELNNQLYQYILQKKCRLKNPKWIWSKSCNKEIIKF